MAELKTEKKKRKEKMEAGEASASVPFDLLQRFMRDVFVAVGVPAEDAAVCADVLISSDKRGIESHGVGRFKPIYIDRIVAGIQDPVTRFEVVREGPTTAVVDGHHGMGHVIGRRAMQLAIDKARRFGLGMVAVRNSTHYGIAGYYALMATAQDMLGVTGTNARPSQAPTFGVENMLGTNPLTFGIPTDEDFPFVLDCATSISQRGKIEVYAREGREVPPGWVVDHEGKTRTDAAGILKDLTAGRVALAPLGGPGDAGAGYKGYGYATVVEILSAALQSGAFLWGLSGLDQTGQPRPYSLGHFFLAVDVAAFTEPADFKRTAGEILRQLRGSKTAPGSERIYTAGELEHLAWLERRDQGVPVNGSLRRELLELKHRYGLDGYRFPFE